MSIDPEQASRAIHATRAGLAAAGYAIDVAAQGDVLLFKVHAQPDACEECLVPKAIFVDILGRELADAGIAAARLDVVYPLDAA